MQHDSDSGDALAAGRRSAQPERTNQYFFWASSTDTNENQSLLSGAPTRAPTPSNSDSESSRVSLSAEADAAGVSRGNSFGASAAYGTFFGRTQIAPEHDVENQSSDGEEQAAEPTHLIPSPQFLLFSAACLGTITMACFVHPPATSFGAIASTVAGNAPTAFCFFFISEIAAQVIEFGRIVDLPRCDPFRAILAGFLGMLINGLGYTLWLRMLTAMIPIDETGVGSETDFGLLLAKVHFPTQRTDFGLLLAQTLIDSLFWGTLSNTVGLVGRRIILECWRVFWGTLSNTVGCVGRRIILEV
ncbi:hypothetical protein T484DRAFT_1801649 [Baffinella frigidus]|nr:hypothetical protein T484DRAFT_1801649 [Cryptophyta sp. CCMP2293]